MTYKRVSGSSSAYTVTSAKSIKGPGGIFISTGYEGFRFDDGSFVIQSGKLVEIGAAPSPSPAPTDDRFNEGWNAAIAAVQALRK